MKKKSDRGENMVYKTIDDLVPPTPAALRRMRERARKANGGTLPRLKIPTPPPSMPKRLSFRPVGGQIRIAVIREINRRKLSGYALWKMAREYCPTLPQSAVYEFLRGERAIGLEYVDAILSALSMRLLPPVQHKRRSA